jgi:hypothetical protein
MSKIEPLSPVSASYGGISKLNAHLDKIETALENTVSRDGSAPNFMTADFDVNSNRIINVLEPVNGGDVATKTYVDTFLGAVTGLVTPVAHTWAKLVDGVLTLDTYAQLTALSAPAANVTYRVRGRTAKGDGGAGDFYYVPGSVTTANDGTVISHASGRFFRIFDSGQYYAAWFGVQAANSAAVNNPLLQAAIDALVAASGGVLELPAGAINFTNVTINGNDITIRGQGATETILTSTYTAGPCITLGGAVTRTANYQFRDIGFSGAIGGTMFFQRYVRGVYFNNFDYTCDRWQKLGDETLGTSFPAYIFHQVDCPSASQISGAILNHIECWNHAGQILMRDVFVEGQYIATTDGFTTTNNIQNRVDHVMITGGYFSRFRVNWNFENGRVVNLYMDSDHLSEGAGQNAIRFVTTAGSSKTIAQVGWELCFVYSQFACSSGTSPAFYMAANQAGGVSCGTFVFAGAAYHLGSYTPIVIDASINSITNLTIRGVDFFGSPPNVNQYVVELIGGTSAANLRNVYVGDITGRAFTNNLAAVVRVSGFIDRVVIDTASIAVTGATTALSDASDVTTPLALTNTTVAATDLITVLDQSQSWSRPMSMQNAADYLGAIGGWRVLAKSAVAVTHTGNTTETALATITIPAGALGPNGAIRVTALTTNNNNANMKTTRFRWDTITGTDFLGYATTTNVTHQPQRTIWNRNSASSQISVPSGITNPFAAISIAPTTATINTANATTFVITGQLANAGDTVTLESYLVEVSYGA